MISGGADTNDTNKHEQTPLLMAHGCRSVCKTLLERKEIKIDAADRYGNQLLHLACRQGRRVDLSISLGADTNAVNKDGQTPLTCNSWHMGRLS